MSICESFRFLSNQTSTSKFDLMSAMRGALKPSEVNSIV